MNYVRSLIAVTLFAALTVTCLPLAEARSVNCPQFTRAAGKVEAPVQGTKRAMQSGISLSQAVAMMQSKYGAKSMRATAIESGGRLIYEIRLRSADGSRVWTVQVDAASGREL